MWHSCGKFSLESLFEGCNPVVWETYKAFERMALEVAPFHVIPQKSRICFQLRVRCAGGSPMKSFFRASFLLPEPDPNPRIVAIAEYGPGQFGHFTKLFKPEDVDEQVRKWLKLSTLYGEQERLKRKE